MVDFSKETFWLREMIELGAPYKMSSQPTRGEPAESLQLPCITMVSRFTYDTELPFDGRTSIYLRLQLAVHCSL